MLGWRRAARLAATTAALMVVGTSAASGATTMNVGNGTLQVGATDLATIGASPCTTSVGVRLAALGAAGEGVCVGTDLDGWGVADATSGVLGRINGGEFPLNITTVSGIPDASGTRLTVVNRVGSALEVTHAFAPSPGTPNVYVATITTKNLTAAPVDLRYRRTTDWDAQPTAFQERVTIGGDLPPSLVTGGAVDLNSLSGTDLNPLVGGRPILAPFGTPVTDNGPADQGTRFDISPGTVNPGECLSFRLFFGAAASEVEASAAVTAAGITTWALIQSNTGVLTGQPATWIAGYAPPASGSGPCPTAQPPAPAPAPAPVVTAAPPATAPAKPATLVASRVFVLPSAKACISRRAFRIRLRVPVGVTAKTATVLVNGKRTKLIKGARLTAPIDLRGLPKGKVTVKITLTTTDGRSVTSARTYRTCVAKKRVR